MMSPLTVLRLLLIISCLRQTLADPEVTFDLQCSQQYINATFTTSTGPSYVSGRNISYTLKDSSCTNSVNTTGAVANSQSTVSLSLTMDHSEGCGTVFSSTDAYIFINQTVLLRIKDTLRGGITQRDYYYTYHIACQMARNISTSNGFFNVSKEVVVDKEETKVVSYNFDMTMKLYTDNTYTTPTSGALTVGVNENVHVSITESVHASEFFFAVQKCQAVKSLSAVATPDVFFDNKCPLDPTFTTVYNDNNTFSFAFQAFFFPSTSDDRIVYLKCFVYVCEKDDSSSKCNQACGSKKRRRRDVSQNSNADGNVRLITVVSDPIILQTEKTCDGIVCGANAKCHDLKPFACVCDEGYVFSRSIRECMKERLVQIDRIHLELEWNINFLNTHSEEFLRLALKYEEVLYRSFMAAGTTHVIEGVKIVKAIKGSVILEVRIIYTATSSPIEAYNFFVMSVKADSRIASTVRKELKFISETKPGIVKIGKPMAESKKLTIIITVVGFLFVVLVIVIVTTVIIKRRNRFGSDDYLVTKRL